MKNINILNNLNSGKTSSYFTINGTKEFTCENNGYVDNVVIEGETLVNLIRTNLPVEVWNNSVLVISLSNYNYFEGTYTLFNFSDKPIVVDIGEATTNNWLRTYAVEANKVKTFNINNGEQIFNVHGPFTNGWENNDTSKNDFRNSTVLLEGDHTDKSISYFEGLKSVGQGDKIEVVSYSKNLDERLDLSNLTWKDGYYVHIGTGAEIVSESHCYTTNYIPIQKTGCNMVFINANPHIVFYDENKNVIYQELGYFPSDDLVIVDVPINAKFLRFTGQKSKKNSVSAYYSQYDKKQIPVTLRSLPNGVKDTIEKRGNKYVKVQRCGEILIDGSSYSIGTAKTNTIDHCIPISDIKMGTVGEKNLYCNIVNVIEGTTDWNKDFEFITVETTKKNIVISLSKTKVNGQSQELFKEYVSTNPITVVYELEKPIITELPNFNLQTYKGDNTLIINSGVVQCDASFDVCEGIRSELDEVKDKVSNLTESVKNSLDSEMSNEINTIKNTVSNNTNEINTIKNTVNTVQKTKMTEDNGACRGIPNNNANDIDITGFWMGANVSNAPTGTYGWVYIESKVHNSLFQVQIATDLHNSERRWIRHKVDGGWSEWRSL